MPACILPTLCSITDVNECCSSCPKESAAPGLASNAFAVSAACRSGPAARAAAVPWHRQRLMCLAVGRSSQWAVVNAEEAKRLIEREGYKILDVRWVSPLCPAQSQQCDSGAGSYCSSSLVRLIMQTPITLSASGRPHCRLLLYALQVC